MRILASAAVSVPILVGLTWLSIDTPLPNILDVDVIENRSFVPGVNLTDADYDDDDERGEDENEDDIYQHLWPIEVLDAYKQQHSAKALADDPFNRKFALVTYWCPDRAGNVLHNMFATMTWAIITNRTILWYYDNSTNNLQDCEQVMKRAEWLPSFVEWSSKLALNPVPIPIDEKRWLYDDQHQTVIFPQIPDVMNRDKAIYRHGWRHDPINLKEYKTYIRELGTDAKIRAGKLYFLGVDFLFGMLFRETFTIQVGDSPKNNDAIISVALHSRHPVLGDDGSFVDEEKKCLLSLLTPYKRTKDTCSVYLMSDRPKTVDILSQWLVKLNCTPIVANHESSRLGKMTTEHGPWAGQGFLQDLDSASAARTAAVGDINRSSFMLLVELMEYNRRLRAFREGKEEANLHVCHLQNKQLAGYDYGPDTPTFRHHSIRSPLPPVKVLEQYKALHSKQSLQVQPDGRKYAIVFYSCSLKADESLHQFMNGKSILVPSV
jgi:hypothetical protein